MTGRRQRTGRWVAGIVTTATVLAAAGCAGGSTHASPRSGSQTTPGTAPLRVVHAHRQVLAVASVTINGHGGFPFVVDSGAARSVVGMSLARSVHLSLGRETRTVSGVTCTSKAKATKVDDWSVGPVRLPATTADALRLPAAERRAGIRGLIGSDVLSEFGSATIDYAGQRLVLGVPAPTPRRGRHVVRLKVSHRNGATLALARVTVAGHGPLVGIIDTGAARSAIARSTARQLHLPHIRRIKVSGVACATTVSVIRVRSWKVGSLPLPPSTAIAANLNRADRSSPGPTLGALIGSDVLSTFGTVEIDYAAQRLITGSRPAASPTSRPATS